MKKDERIDPHQPHRFRDADGGLAAAIGMTRSMPRRRTSQAANSD
jgi:hypothetical protein